MQDIGTMPASAIRGGLRWEWDMGPWAWQGRAVGTGPAAAFLGRERFQGAGMWSWSMDRMGRAMSRAGQGQSGLLVASRCTQYCEMLL